jgi:hypothetical protein
MSKVLPSQIVAAIDSLFGGNRNEIDSGMLDVRYRSEIHALLYLLDEVPRELIDLATNDYLEYTRCRAVLTTALAYWNASNNVVVKNVGGKDAIERIRRLMKQCHDELPPPQPILPFISDNDVRAGIEDRIQAAWTDFNAREWMGATVFAGAALEALLLWALKSVTLSKPPKQPLDHLYLVNLISAARENGIIGQNAEQQASLARDARNLVHPGRAVRSGQACSKSTALTALAAVYRVIEEMKALRP